jgi:4-amino-4-deoxy-L-arabinose transferase-like glycosyltransferase
MMKLPFETKSERIMASALLLLWAVLFLPNLRTNPKWYGDEGEWMEKCWTFIHGEPRVGPVKNDFIFPYPYPPVYMLVNGSLLRIFGEDIVVGRALGAVTALAAAALLFWIGCRLRDKQFGFLCAAAFLVYNEAVMNFRWVRSHPMAGAFALASVGFLIRYVQEKRWRDAVLAGSMCALATGTHYMTYPLIGAVLATVAVVNARNWRTVKAWSHVLVAGAMAGSYAGAFVLWYTATSGWTPLMEQTGRLLSIANNEARPTFAGEVERFVQNVWTLGFKTPTKGPPPGWSGKDWWLAVATLGFVFLPVKDKWMRLWVPFWLLVLMYGVFKKLNNVPMFFYPATVFLPLMAVGFAGVWTWAGELLVKSGKGASGGRALPGLVACGLFAATTLSGSLGGFKSKIDTWSQFSVTEAEAAMKFVNERTGSEDVVAVPKQIYWLVKNGKRSMLTWCARYNGVVNDMPVPVEIPRSLYAYDCRLENTKFVVMASGVNPQTQQGVGIDLIYAQGLRGVPEVVAQMLTEKWPVVWHGGAGATVVNVGNGRMWPVAVGGEYLVFANPRLMKSSEQAAP